MLAIDHGWLVLLLLSNSPSNIFFEFVYIPLYFFTNCIYTFIKSHYPFPAIQGSTCLQWAGIEKEKLLSLYIQPRERVLTFMCIVPQQYLIKLLASGQSMIK